MATQKNILAELDAEKLEERRKKIFRRAAAENVGTVRGYGGKVDAPMNPSLGYVPMVKPFEAFLTEALKGASDEEILAAILQGSCKISPKAFDKEARRWISQMHENERSATHIVVGPNEKALYSGFSSVGYAEQPNNYCIHTSEEATIYLMPGHVLKWYRAYRMPLRSVAKRNRKDDEKVLEVFCKIYEPNAVRSDGARQALQAARDVILA